MYRKVVQIVRRRAEARLAAVSHQGVDGDDVLAGVAVTQRAPATRVVAHHAADGCARRSRHIDGKPQAVTAKLPVEIVKHDARLNGAATVAYIDAYQLVEVL